MRILGFNGWCRSQHPYGREPRGKLLLPDHMQWWRGATWDLPEIAVKPCQHGAGPSDAGRNHKGPARPWACSNCPVRVEWETCRTFGKRLRASCQCPPFDFSPSCFTALFQFHKWTPCSSSLLEAWASPCVAKASAGELAELADLELHWAMQGSSSEDSSALLEIFQRKAQLILSWHKWQAWTGTITSPCRAGPCWPSPCTFFSMVPVALACSAAGRPAGGIFALPDALQVLYVNMASLIIKIFFIGALVIAWSHWFWNVDFRGCLQQVHPAKIFLVSASPVRQGLDWQSPMYNPPETEAKKQLECPSSAPSL